MCRNQIETKHAVGLLLCLAFAGCTAGTHVYFHPSNASHSCVDVDFSAHTVTVAHDTWIYAGVPLGRNKEDRTQGNLMVEFFARSSSPIELSADDFHVLDLHARTEYEPVQLLILRQFFLEKTGKYYIDYKAEFAVTNNDLEEFDLVFHVPLSGCDIPPIHYLKGSSRHYTEPIN